MTTLEEVELYAEVLTSSTMVLILLVTCVLTGAI